eukprot:522042_1
MNFTAKFKEGVLQNLNYHLNNSHYGLLNFRDASVCGHVNCKSRKQHIRQCLDAMVTLNYESRLEDGVKYGKLQKRIQACIDNVQSSCKVCIFMLLPHMHQHFYYTWKRSFVTNDVLLIVQSTFYKMSLHSNLVHYCYRDSNIWYWPVLSFITHASLLNRSLLIMKENKSFIAEW